MITDRAIVCIRTGRRGERPLIDDATRILAARLIARRLVFDNLQLRSAIAARPGDAEWVHAIDDDGGIVSKRKPL